MGKEGREGREREGACEVMRRGRGKEGLVCCCN